MRKQLLSTLADDKMFSVMQRWDVELSCCFFDREAARQSGDACRCGIGKRRSGAIGENARETCVFKGGWLMRWTNFINFANGVAQAIRVCRSARKFCYE